MDFLKTMLKNLPAEMLLKIFIPIICNKIGADFKKKDANETGADDATGNLFFAFGTAAAAYDSTNENAFKKALRAVRNTINVYLGE